MRLSHFLVTTALGLAGSTFAAEMLFGGLVQNAIEYDRHCNQQKTSKLVEPRRFACFTTNTDLSQSLSNPYPSEIDGFIDGSGRNFLLFASEHGSDLADDIRVVFQQDLTMTVSRFVDESVCVQVGLNGPTDQEGSSGHSEGTEQSFCPGHDDPIPLSTA